VHTRRIPKKLFLTFRQETHYDGMAVQKVDRIKMINLRLNFKYTRARKIIVSTIISMRSNNISEGSVAKLNITLF